MPTKSVITGTDYRICRQSGKNYAGRKKLPVTNRLQIQLRSATSQCVLHEKTTAGLPQRQGCIAPESVESISNTIKKETEVSLGLTIFVLL